MNDVPKDDHSKPGKPDDDDDEPIIDLVDEIIDSSPRKDPSQLPSELWDLEGVIEEIDADAPDLPDVGDLGSLEFEEAHEPAGDGASLDAASTADAAPLSDDDLHWLLEQKEDTSLPARDEVSASPDSDVAEFLDFDEDFLDDADLLESLPDSNGTDANGEVDAEEDIDTLEIIEIEDEEIDDEIIWFDDSTEEAPFSETEDEFLHSETPAAEKDDTLLSERFAADRFEVPLQSGTPRPEDRSGIPGLEDVIAPAAAAGLAGQRAAAVSSAIDSDIAPETLTPADHTAGLSPEAIEAALERVIDRKFGGAMESLILQAIEKAVSKEIERLKHLLLEDDPADRI